MKRDFDSGDLRGDRTRIVSSRFERSYANFSNAAQVLGFLGVEPMPGGGPAWLTPSSDLSPRRRRQLNVIMRRGKAVAERTRSRLLVLLITDGHSVELHEEYGKRRIELGAAGEEILFADIGDPRLMDRLFRRILSEEGLRVSNAAIREYLRRVRDAVNETAFRQDCTEILVEARRLGDVPRPFLLFIFTKKPGAHAVLPVGEEVLVSPDRMKHFWRRLCEECTADKLIYACPPGTFTTDDEQPLLQSYLERLSHLVTTDGRSGRVVLPSRFPTPDGTPWERVSLRFKDAETLVAQVKGRPPREVGFAEMGMQDRRTGLPSLQWALFREFATDRGEFGWSSEAAGPKVQKRREKLAALLKAYFQIDEDPIEWLPDRKVWRTKFLLSPPPDAE